MFIPNMTVLYWDVLGLAAYTPEMAMLGRELENHGVDAPSGSLCSKRGTH